MSGGSMTVDAPYAGEERRRSSPEERARYRMEHPETNGDGNGGLTKWLLSLLAAAVMGLITAAWNDLRGDYNRHKSESVQYRQEQVLDRQEIQRDTREIRQQLRRIERTLAALARDRGIRPDKERSEEE